MAEAKAQDFGSNRWTAASRRGFEGLDREREGEWTAPFFFAALADPQFGLKEKNQGWAEEVELAEQAVATLNKLQPRFAIVCGDLVNHMPELYPGTEPGIREKQIVDFKRVFSGVDPSIPLLCVCGNHDVGDTPNQTTLDRYTNDFGDDYYSFWVGGMCGIVINSNLYYDPAQADSQFEDQQKWLKETLETVRGQGPAHVVLFTHHPLFLKSAGEGEETSEIGETQFTTPTGELVRLPNKYFHIPLERRAPLLQLLNAHGVQWVFSGHWHQCHTVEDANIKQVVTSAVGMGLGSDKSGIRIVRVKKDEIDHAYYEFEQMPEKVEL